MPGWLAAVAASAFPRRSIEGAYRFACQIGHVHPFVISAVALLGVTAPGVGVLSGLPDIASLYGLSASAADGTAWRTQPEDMRGGPVMAVTEEDVRRAYYAQAGAPQTWWITELQMSPTQLVVSDGDGKIYLVPFAVDGEAVSFGDAAELDYTGLAAARGTGALVAYASAQVSRSVVMAAWDGPGAVAAMGEDPSPGAIKAMFALPSGTKTDSSLPHHECSGGQVGAANQQACTAAIAALNGARGGLKGVSAGQAKSAYSHLAAHLRSMGAEPPEFKGAGAAAAAGDDDGDALEVTAGGVHAVHNGSHSHAHPALGSQGGDATHTHDHSHAYDNRHDHSHQPAAAAAGTNREGRSDVDLTEDQITSLRKRLGLADDAELDGETLDAAVGQLHDRAVRAAAGQRLPLPQGVMVVETEAWKALNDRVAASEAYRKSQEVKERDTVIAAAVSDGKFTVARADHWRRLWDADPQGTREVLATLRPNVVPVSDIGAAGPGIEDAMLEDEYKALFPPGAVK
jgi:hypothetical protein